LSVLVVAPHPDDELLGCGGTLLKRLAAGKNIAWVIVSSISTEHGWDKLKVSQRDLEINLVSQGLKIKPEHLYRFNFPATALDQVPLATLVARFSQVFTDFQPSEVFLPFPGDVHSDHRITFEAAAACTKWFRYPSIKRVLTYETLSETDFAVDFSRNPFNPNFFVDISEFVKGKQDLLSAYSSEIHAPPFPRSLKAVAALATIRGAQMGVDAAEAFSIVRQFE